MKLKLLLIFVYAEDTASHNGSEGSCVSKMGGRYSA